MLELVHPVTELHIPQFMFSFQNFKDQSNEQQHANGLIVSCDFPQPWINLIQTIFCVFALGTLLHVGKILLGNKCMLFTFGNWLCHIFLSFSLSSFFVKSDSIF